MYLLIDAKNIVYRSILSNNGEKYHHVTIFMRQLSSWVKKYKPTSVAVAWDAPRKSTWRRNILETYKDRGELINQRDISKDISITMQALKELLDNINVRQLYKDKMEADDLIYAAVSVIHPEKSVIVSSDGDMLQIPYKYHSCKVFNPFKKQEMPRPEISPVMQKALVGDNSDRISGYRGIGPKKSEQILESFENLNNFLSDNDKSIFYKNLLLIDLSLNPKLMNNKVYVMKELSSDIKYNDVEVNKLIMKYRIKGMLNELNDLIPCFKNLQ